MTRPLQRSRRRAAPRRRAKQSPWSSTSWSLPHPSRPCRRFLQRPLYSGEIKETKRSSGHPPPTQISHQKGGGIRSICNRIKSLHNPRRRTPWRQSVSCRNLSFKPLEAARQSAISRGRLSSEGGVPLPREADRAARTLASKNRNSSGTLGLHMHTTLVVNDDGVPLCVPRIEYDAPDETPEKNKLRAENAAFGTGVARLTRRLARRHAGGLGDGQGRRLPVRRSASTRKGCWFVQGTAASSGRSCPSCSTRRAQNPCGSV